MADTYTKFEGTLSYGSTTTLYTTPASKMFYLKGFYIANIAATNCDCRVNIGSTPIVPGNTIPANETLMLNDFQGYVLTGETITGTSLSSGKTLLIRGWGIEVSV